MNKVPSASVDGTFKDPFTTIRDGQDRYSFGPKTSFARYAGRAAWVTDAEDVVLNSFLELQDDWDGMGGGPPTPMAYDSAKMAIKFLANDRRVRKVEVMPSSDGGYTFEVALLDEDVPLAIVDVNPDGTAG